MTIHPPPIEVGLAIILRPLNGGQGLLEAPQAQNDREVLLTKRPSDTVYGGYWEFPGGKIEVEIRETPESCAVREALEEVGLAVNPVSTLAPVVHTYEHGTVRLRPVICALKDPLSTPRNIEVIEHAWVTPARLEELSVTGLARGQEGFLPGNIEVVRALGEYLAHLSTQDRKDPTP